MTHRFIGLFLFLGLLLLPASARAGVEAATECDDDCRAMSEEVARAWLGADALQFAPPSVEETVRFESASACAVERDASPVVHAVVLAPFYRKFVELPGTQNDARLLEGYFHDRGVQPPFMHIITGDAVTRRAMLEALEKSLSCVRSRDQVVFVFTGGSTSYDRWLAPTTEQFVELACASEMDIEGLEQFCARAETWDDAFGSALIEIYAKEVAEFNELILFSSEINIDINNVTARGDTLVTGLGATDLSNYVTQVRNRGADAFVVLDANYAAGARLLAKQRDAVPDSGWYWDTGEEDVPAEVDINADLVPLFGSGHFAAFYATNEKELALEGAMGQDQVILGHFMFTFAEALRQQPQIALTELAKLVAKSMKDNGIEQTPVFEASATSLRFLVPREEPAPNEKDIEVISPEMKRGATEAEGRRLEVVARYTGAGKAVFANIDGQPMRVDTNGQFRAVIEDVTGKTAIPLRVYSQSNEQLAARTIQIGAEPREEIFEAPPGGRYALVISNQAYSSDSFPHLATPKADGDAVASLLATRFGFKLRYESEKSPPLELRLENANKIQVQQILFDLRQRLTAEDQLLIYYAGHGENDPELGAYWVPVDGQPNADFTWIDANEITRELARMNALSVLVISDSCYSGGLSRSSTDEKSPSEARERWLNKAARLKARQLMASGGEEPVSDGGGDGHSVFARALIEALQSMPGSAFTASELFEVKVKPAVIAAASALTEGQVPGFHRISKAGDEPSSEFIFQVTGSAQ